mgnify:CR=1 FL=1|jgi:hypothetical protein
MKIKIKIISNLSYQTFPEVEGMVEVDDETLQRIGVDLQFDGIDGSVIPYTPPKFELEIGYDELVDQKIRTKYTVSQELAILRQRDTKPDEYNEYFNFCEECKRQAKEEIGM